MITRRLPAGLRMAALLAAPVMLSTCGDNGTGSEPPDDTDAVQIKTLSNRADLVSGGDVLVEIVPFQGAADAGLHVALGGSDITEWFSKGTDGRILAVVKDLPEGPSTITADISGKGAAKLVITNHKIGGPVFSGPQITPWICAGPAPLAESGNTAAVSSSGLAGTASTDGQCNIAAEKKLYYRTTATVTACQMVLPDPIQPLAHEVTPPPGQPRKKITDPPTPVAPPANGCFKPFDPANRPTDIAMTTLDTGATVPFIVQVERGTINRGIYDIAVLYDPASGSWNPTAPPTTWNRKVLYAFGPSTGQPRRQQRSSQAWTAQVDALGRGFAIAVNSMTDSAFNSNRVTMSETVMMMKEHIVDAYGEIKYTIGTGCSGGSINQLTATSIYPGLLDGLQPGCTYPDSETTGVEVADCESLVRVYASQAWKDLMTREGKDATANANAQTAINGHLDYMGCRSWFNAFTAVARPGTFRADTVSNTPDAVITTAAAADANNNCTLPPAMVYDPTVSGSSGVRCAGQDFAVSVWGKVAGTSRAVSTRDNVGVVFGLKAFLDHNITAEEFVTVNEKLGGSDADLNRTDARSVADEAALAIAYKSGIVTDGKHLANVPILDLRGWDEQGIHYIWRSYSLRARLDKANGGHGNHVIWQFSKGIPFFTDLLPNPATTLSAQSLTAMDKWLTTMRAASPTATLAQVVAARPAEGTDGCYLTTDPLYQNKITDQAVCNADERLVSHASPRQIAGGPVDENILKCQLKPFNAADYPGLDQDQLTRLQSAFPTGVCDWSKPGVGQQDAVSPLDFSAGPGGVALQAAPVSQKI